MFKKLKRKFILTNLLTSTAVLVVAFSAIYVVAASSANQRISKPVEFRSGNNSSEQAQPDQTSGQSQSYQSQSDQNDIMEQFNQEMSERLATERQASLNSLLISLVVTGAAMELVIALISFYLAEQSIKPVRDAYLAQKAFVANASHEIKTPLAVIQANLEAADIHGNHWLENVEKKVEDLAALNNQLLTLARMDSTKTEIKLTDVNLGQLVSDTFDFYAPQIADQKIKLKINRPKRSAKTRLNEPDFVQILNILIDNAIKYSDHKITAEVTERSVKIENDGATIQKDDLRHVFDRFYQTDKTKNGVGLGLAIAKQIADKNDWKLKADSNSKTTSFTLELK